MFEKIIQNKDEWLRLTPSTALYDRTLVWLYLSLLVFGFVMVTSASIPVGLRLRNDAFHYALRDGVYIISSIAVVFFCVQIPIKKWEKYNGVLFGVALLLLFLVLAVGSNINGAKRWISLGILNFQPAELAKLSIICYFASFYVRKFDEIRTGFASAWRPMTILALFGGFLLLQPDLGSTFVLFVLTFAMLFIVGAKLLQFIILGFLGLGLIAFFIVTSNYRLARVKTFLDPWADAYGDGFQLTNSQMAFGQGEWFGRGLGNSVQKLGYLPEANTDFVMAVIGEELGFMGILAVIILFVLLSIRAFKISSESLRSEERFKGFLSFGIGIWIFLQSFVNLGVTTGLLPTKGLTFPFISYGGSSLMIMSVAIAILLRIDFENRLEKVKYANPKDY
ncbi:Cell division protein FtsW [Phocoenobacter uteri]|uniref:Probable peptidoglycan glycosyltransferase FtsW n=1 Tax=Phocoenobacter uteri TaxID=146806 RepID=A0A379CDB8_9PAST|nr:putative lipid II flippase FtsW [Phocoenobacter uteri]MDG6881711.1 cell division protein FtsW [Phocoenobacter uteri]SUB59746.1 Cell division protein FtsW [Phocoenobacter uteri]